MKWVHPEGDTGEACTPWKITGGYNGFLRYSGTLGSNCFSKEVRTALFEISRDMIFPAMWVVRPAKAQTSLRIRAVWSESLLFACSMTVKLLTEQHLEHLSVTGGCTCASESTCPHVKIPHCWKSHVEADDLKKVTEFSGSALERAPITHVTNVKHGEKTFIT